jgi:hypothetical protein
MGQPVRDRLCIAVVRDPGPGFRFTRRGLSDELYRAGASRCTGLPTAHPSHHGDAPEPSPRPARRGDDADRHRPDDDVGLESGSSGRAGSPMARSALSPRHRPPRAGPGRGTPRSSTLSPIAARPRAGARASPPGSTTPGLDRPQGSVPSQVRSANGTRHLGIDLRIQRPQSRDSVFATIDARRQMANGVDPCQAGERS